MYLGYIFTMKKLNSKIVGEFEQTIPGIQKTICELQVILDIEQGYVPQHYTLIQSSNYTEDNVNRT